VPEGVLPNTEDTTYERKTALIKFLGTTREVTLQMLMVRAAHGDVVALETMAGTNWLLRILEKSLFYGDSTVVTEEFDGIDAQIKADASAPVIDLRGQPLLEGTITQATQLIADNFGVPTDLYLSHRSVRDLSLSLLPKERTLVPVAGNGDLGFGFAFTNMNTDFGKIAIHPDVFIKEGAAPPSLATSANAPGVPSAVSGTASNTNSKLGTATYKYIITGLNRFGESAGSSEVTQAITGGNHITLTITPGSGTTEGYAIYRTGAGGSVEKFLFKQAATAVVDDGTYVEGTGVAWLVQRDLENLSFKQLAPFMKVPLATIAPSVRFMMLLFGTPVVYSPRKNCRIINIGPAA
jgi:hypothetical protein